MAGRIRVDIMAEVGPMLAHAKQSSLSGTAALVHREVAQATQPLPLQLLTVQQENSGTVGAL
jgi:hypothetical protein